MMLDPNELAWLVQVRRHLHRHPELSGEEVVTAAYIQDCLTRLGLPFVAGIGGHGIVATIEGKAGNQNVGLRADMDALPIQERTGLPHASCHPGRMHACGHDGHVAILLGAAILLSRDRTFRGNIHLIFQPSEERYGGAGKMIADGLLHRFPIDHLFGLHNWPGLPTGQVVVHDGPVMAGASDFTLRFSADGAHAAMPHLTGDPLLAGGYFMVGLQQAVGRSVDPLDHAVATVGSFNGGIAQNVIPQQATLAGTLRGYRTETLAHLRGRVRAIAAASAEVAACGWSLDFEEPSLAPVVNTAQQRDIMRSAARKAGLDLGPVMPPSMCGDDFGDILAHIPGAYALLGNGPAREEAGLHQPLYEFNDAVIPSGAHLLALAALIALTEQRLPTSGAT